MLYIKFRVNRPTGSGEEDFWAFVSMAAMLSM